MRYVAEPHIKKIECHDLFETAACMPTASKYLINTAFCR